MCTQTARADTRDATCEVRKDGDTVALRPADKANHFKDQHGNKVVRTQSSGNHQAFKWDKGKHINVTLNPSTYNHNKHNQSGYNPQGGYGQNGGGSHDHAPPQIMLGSNGEDAMARYRREQGMN